MTNRIRQLREEKHMTQVRLSIELGVSQETISSYEKEKHYPSFVQLKRISELFGTSIDYAMGLSDIRIPVAVQSEEMCINELISLCKTLSGKQLELVFAYARGISDNNALEKGAL